jgi:hypothetical protein
MREGRLTERDSIVLTRKELARLRRLLTEIDQETSGKSRRAVIQTRTRNGRLLLSKAERRVRKEQTRNSRYTWEVAADSIF